MHGDLHYDNLLFSGDEVRPIDFTGLRLAHYAYDMGVTLYHIFYQGPQIRRAFFEGYQQRATLPEEYQRGDAIPSDAFAARYRVAARYIGYAICGGRSNTG